MKKYQKVNSTDMTDLIRRPKHLFKKGQSGNPQGRPKNAMTKAKIAVAEAMCLLEGQAQLLTKKAVELALSGDVTALKMCLDRLLPIKKDTHISGEIVQKELKDYRITFDVGVVDDTKSCGNDQKLI